MKSTTIAQLLNMKAQGEKIAMLTAYDASFAKVLSTSGVEVLLVGDTLGMVVAGYPTTVPVTMDEMVYHTSMVARGNQGSLILGDLPFMSYSNPQQTIENATRLMQAGANMVKGEGGAWLQQTIELLSERGIPFCAHLGLTPQSVDALGGFRVQGRDPASAQRIIDEALLLEKVGAKMLVLECVPHTLAADISGQLTIPVIGIGAGPSCDGQVLVSYDLLGLTNDMPLRFVRNFMQGCDTGISAAIEAYVQAVKAQTFPSLEESFS